MLLQLQPLCVCLLCVFVLGMPGVCLCLACFVCVNSNVCRSYVARLCGTLVFVTLQQAWRVSMPSIAPPVRLCCPSNGTV